MHRTDVLAMLVGPAGSRVTYLQDRGGEPVWRLEITVRPKGDRSAVDSDVAPGKPVTRIGPPSAQVGL